MRVQGRESRRHHWLALLLLLFGTAHAQELASRIVVVSVHGDVTVTANGVRSQVDQGDLIVPPVFLSTGENGAAQLRQGDTQFSIAPGTALEIPASADPASLIDLVIQSRGSVFYDVAPREASRLRVETPYLVAVVKGTQFNVAVQDEGTTVSLFEGRLGIETPDGADALDLEAGEIAIGYGDQASIIVLRMDEEAPDEAEARAPGQPAEEPDRLLAGAPGDQAVARTADLETSRIDGAIRAGNDPVASPIGLDGGLAVDLKSVEPALRGDLVVTADAGLDASIDLNEGELAAQADGKLDLGAAIVDAALDARLDLPDGGLAVGADASLDLGGASLDAGVDAGLDLGGGDLTAAADAGLDLGGVSLGAGLDAGLDLGGGDLATTADAGLDLGGVSLDAGLDLAGGGLAAGADLETDIASADLGLGGASDGGVVDASLDAGVDLGAATLDAGLDVGLGGETGVGLAVDLGELEIGLDLGGNSDSGDPGAQSGGGGLLGGLLGR